MHSSKHRMVAAVLLTSSLGGLATACGGSVETESEMNAAAGNPDYLFDRVEHVRTAPALDNVLEPASLEEAMPNHEFKAQNAEGSAIFSFSDAVAAGKVTDVRKGDGYTYESGDAATLVSFDDPKAAARDLVVTVAADQVAGADARTVKFRMGVLLGSDPEKLMESLRGLGETVVVLEKIRSGSHAGEYIPVMSGALIGQVGASGSTEFPALGSSEDKFVGDLDTVTEIFEATTDDPPVEKLG